MVIHLGLDPLGQNSHLLETLCCLHVTAFEYSHSLVQTRDLTVDLAEFFLARLHPLADGVPNLSLEVTKGLLVVLLQILNSEHDVSVDPLVDGILELSPSAVHGLEITVDLAESVLSWLDPLSDGLAQLILEVGNGPGVGCSICVQVFFRLGLRPLSLGIDLLGFLHLNVDGLPESDQHLGVVLVVRVQVGQLVLNR